MRPAELVRRLPDAVVVVLGDLVADEYVYGETTRVSREAPVPIVQHESSETKLGGAANAAANVAALGAKVRPVGVVGRDPAGREMLRLFRENGADPSHVLAIAGRHTETKTRILAGGRSTTRQQMLRLDRADERPLAPAQRRALRERVRAACEGARSLVVSDYGGGLFDGEMIALVRELGRRLPVCVDSRYDLHAFHGVTVAKPNEPELEAAVGRRLKGPEDVEAAGRALLSKLDVEALLVTRGRNGMTLFQRGRESVAIPVWGPDEAVDVTGAGDTVLATFASALAVGASFEAASRLANVAGGIVVQKPGTATCSHAELAAAVGAGAKRRARTVANAASRRRP